MSTELIVLEEIPCPLPLESIPRDHRLNGQGADNRLLERNELGVDDDASAVLAWLSEYRDSPQTFRAYRKEAERLLLWALLMRHKPLSSLNREDLREYETFLRDPQPAWFWCGPNSGRREVPGQWHPFVKGLGDSSRRQAILVLNGLFGWLVEACYLKRNPLALRRGKQRDAKDRARSSAKVERFLDRETLRFVLGHLESWTRKTEKDRRTYERARFLLRFLFLMGPRVSELANSRMGSVHQQNGRWWWRVHGKGGKIESIPMQRDAVEALMRYRVHLGLAKLPRPTDQEPLAHALSGRKGIGANMIYRIVKAIFQEAAAQMEQDDPIRAAHLAKASTHWMRHTAITHQANAGIELRYIQRSARHAKMETTGRYLHAEEDEWHRNLEKHTLDPVDPKDE